MEKLGRSLAKAQGLDYDTELAKTKAGMEESLREAEERAELLSQLPDRLSQFLDDHKVANKLLAKWFNASNVQEDGSYYNVKLIQDRGIYSASELEKLRARESVRGRAILADAGMELLSHTYVSFTYFDYQTSQDIDKTGKKIGAELFGTRSKFGDALQKKYDDNIQNVSGFSVQATTYLFRLRWNKDLENLFIAKYFNAPVSDLLNCNDFEMEYVGYQPSPSVLYTERTGKGAEGNYLVAGEATIRAIDKSLTYLQRKFEDFRIKAPLIDVDKSEITAFIGTKEGVEPSSVFEVLERTYNEKNNSYDYKKVTTLKIDKKKPIFDNEYVLGQEEEPVGKTYFKGDETKLAPGMLIRQKK